MLRWNLESRAVPNVEAATNLGNDYHKHRVFEELLLLEEFYDSLAYGVFGFMTRGAGSAVNIDSYVLSSVSGTLHSIRRVASDGHLSDAYTLLRKYHDLAVLNLHINLIIERTDIFETPIIESVRSWVRFKHRFPKYSTMMKDIQTSEKTLPLRGVFDLTKGGQYDAIRDRCNDHTHVNLFRYALLNDANIHIERLIWLDNLYSDVRQLFAFHISHLFLVCEHYMASSDYVDALEVGMTPEDGSQYWVAPFVQEALDRCVTPLYPAAMAALATHTEMMLRVDRG